MARCGRLPRRPASGPSYSPKRHAFRAAMQATSAAAMATPGQNDVRPDLSVGLRSSAGQMCAGKRKRDYRPGRCAKKREGMENRVSEQTQSNTHVGDASDGGEKNRRAREAATLSRHRLVLHVGVAPTSNMNGNKRRRSGIPEARLVGTDQNPSSPWVSRHEGDWMQSCDLILSLR